MVGLGNRLTRCPLSRSGGGVRRPRSRSASRKMYYAASPLRTSWPLSPELQRSGFAFGSTEAVPRLR